MKTRNAWWQRLALAGAVAVLGAVFVSYLDPHLAADLASRFWACF